MYIKARNYVSDVNRNRKRQQRLKAGRKIANTALAALRSIEKMEGKSSPKREFKQLRSRNQKILRSNLLEAIAQANSGGVVSHMGEDGVLRMKIVVRKQDLKQMLGIINGGGTGGRNISGNHQSPPSPSVEERLNQLLRRKHVLMRSHAIKKSAVRRSWSPELQSIPEEY